MQPPSTPFPTRRILRMWWPLAASWLLMGAELPLFTAFVARMAFPEVNLAAYGSVVFPVSLVVEAPIIMLLAASTALSSNWDDYRKLRRFMLTAGSLLTLVHVAIAFTPLYDFVAAGLIGAPAEVVEPARLGLRIMTPWTFSIAYRRFYQGVLIRFDRSRAVGLGTLVRLGVNTLVLASGYLHGGVSGIVVGTCAIACAVLAEAFFVGWCVRPVVRERLRNVATRGEPLTRARFLRFYVPLAMTPLLTLVIQPIGAAAMSRMPLTLPSLAAWPAVHGLVFIPRGVGMAYNEVVVALFGEPGAPRALRRFTRILASILMVLLLAFAVTPLAGLWFEQFSGLSPELSDLCRTSVLLSLLMPGYTVLQSWFQGLLVARQETRAITEAVALYLIVVSIVLAIGVRTQAWTGVYYAIAAFSLGGVLQTTWLWWRSRAVSGRD